MTTRNFIFISLAILPFMAQGQKAKNDSGKVVAQDIRLKEVVENVEPPPPFMTSKFKTLYEWLLDICVKGKPQKPISKYEIGFFESQNDYSLYLVGVNTYNKGKNHSVTLIEFKPANMYFKLPENYFKNLNREQLLEKLTSQLKDFTNTKIFKTSFLAKANVITFDANGTTIWARQ